MSGAKAVRVLFVCLGNACRSPMAEAIARHNASDVIEASSAGLFPLGYVVGLTQETLRANGYPNEELSSKPLRRETMENSDLIINMSGQRLDHIFGSDNPGVNEARMSQKVEDWNVEDPYGQDLVTYQKILVEIESRVLALAKRLRADQKQDEP
jgi:protein-tyrosine-phosphatase